LSYRLNLEPPYAITPPTQITTVETLNGFTLSRLNLNHLNKIGNVSTRLSKIAVKIKLAQNILTRPEKRTLSYRKPLWKREISSSLSIYT
jgi:hypothetical protein